MPDRSDAVAHAPEPGTVELIERVRELEHALKTRDDLLAIAAHELRNPMHSLLLQVSAALQIARKRDDAEMQMRLERIKNVVDRYVKRATVLLDACRHQAHQFQLNLEDCDLSKILEDIVDSFSAEAAFNRTSLSLQAPPGIKGRWDRLALEQIVCNLISNAIKYGAGEPVEVELALLSEDRVSLIVRDRGIGISSADHRRIFEQFERVTSLDERRSGFGIGLWLVRSLVHAHAGEVDVASELGRGATFTVVLPRNTRDL